MTFNRSDLEDDDDFNLNDFDAEDDDGFSFEDEEAPDVSFDDDGFDFDEDMPAEEEAEESQGINRTFIIIAALMIALFVIGLVVLLALVSQPRPPTPTELTATYIVEQNATTEALLFITQTAAVEIAQASATAAVEVALAQTMTAAVPPTDTPIPTDTPTPTLDPTEIAQQMFLTQTALELTQTAEFLLTPPTQEALQPPDVALTATALAILLAPPTIDPGMPPTPTPEGFVPTTAPIAPPTALPDTGFFDDLAAGGGGMGAFALMALGLLAVIMVSRRMRAANDK